MIFTFSLFLLSAGYHTVVKADGGWRSHLPWNELESSIAGDLVDTSPSDYLQECAPEFEKERGNLIDPNNRWSRSMHAMINQPSGLCLPHFFCSFENCAPATPDQHPQSTSAFQQILDASMVPPPTLYSDMNTTIKGWIEDTSNPNYNLPSKVLFPKEAKDVVASVKFAKEHGLEISIKNSGHSFTSASSKGDTLHLNMNRYYHYAMNDGVIDCDADSIGDGLSDQPCRLSLAKGKNAVIRTGGGENWQKVYGAVRKANEDQPDGFKYHAVGGAAATVSPMGWTFSAGLSGTTAGRMLGFGVDQVLQLEMVLPNGSHVKFGPTEWEEQEGYDVPKTLSVSGLCNTNPEAAEEDWVWDDCPEDFAVNFDDLWFAVRGGGGGTWGVVLSVYLQLHEYMPYELIVLNSVACVGDKLDEAQKATWNFLYQMFEIKFLLDPTSIGVTEDEANACGTSDSGTNFHCYGDGSSTIVDNAWKTFLVNNRGSLEGVGVAPGVIDEAANCEVEYKEGSNVFVDTIPSVFSPKSTVLSYKDYVQSIQMPETAAFPGLGIDSPPPAYAALNYQNANILIPKKWILDNILTAAQLVAPSPTAYRAFGGKTASAVSDQMNSLSDAHREAGYMSPAPFVVAYNDVFFSTLMPQMFDMGDKSNFPAFLGANHAGLYTRGPLKSDWTKACPLEWSQEERDEKCISLQECIWGTKLLKRLEEIKEAIDPDYMFDCTGCVGNNRVKSVPSVYNCKAKNPCDPLLTTGKFHYPHVNEKKFVQCSEYGECFVKRCPRGQMFDDIASVCVFV